MFKTMLDKINACGNDVSMYTDEDKIVHLTIDDFAGFDEHWNEIFRKYDNPKAVKALTIWLLENCLSWEDDYYIIYHFNGFDVQLGYTSFDI